MSAQLDRDLGAWERGELDRERLLVRHGADAASVVALHERLAGIAASTRIPDPEAGWTALLVRLEALAPVVPLRRHARRRRTVALLVAAALTAAAAFAAVRASAPPARSAPASVLTPSVRSFGPNHEVRMPQPTSADEAPSGGSSIAPDGGSASGAGKGTTGATTSAPPDHPWTHHDNGIGNGGRDHGVAVGGHGGSPSGHSHAD